MVQSLPVLEHAKSGSKLDDPLAATANTKDKSAILNIWIKSKSQGLYSQRATSAHQSWKGTGVQGELCEDRVILQHQLIPETASSEGSSSAHLCLAVEPATPGCLGEPSSSKALTSSWPPPRCSASSSPLVA